MTRRAVCPCPSRDLPGSLAAVSDAGPSRWRWVPWSTGAAVAVVLALTATGYGWHRDELYFVIAGRHLAWGYPDQPPLTPLVASVLAGIGGADPSLPAVRLGAALCALVVLAAAVLTCREFGGSARAAGMTALVVAAGPLVLVNGHLLTTTATDMAVSATVVWLLVRAVRTAQDRWFLVAGLVTGAGMMNKTSFVVLPGIMVLSMAAFGPRWPLRRPAVWGAAAIAGLVAAPNLIWQAQHGWPQLQMARVISEGFDPGGYALLVLACAGLLLVPVTVAGVRLLLTGRLSGYRFVAVTWLALVLLYLLLRGKGYYTAGPVPALVAAGALSVDGWLDRGRASLRRALLVTGLAVQACVSALVGLPLVPTAQLASTPIPGISKEIGSQLGWPSLVEDVRAALWSLPTDARGRAVILTANYGEAGALLLLGGPELAPTYSGHNAFASWGPPPEAASPVVLIGFSDHHAAQFFTGCTTLRHQDNGTGVDTEEQGSPVRVCRGPSAPWSSLWGELSHLS